MSNSLLVAVDLGGTKMLATVLDESLNEVASKKNKTPVGGDQEDVYEAIMETITDACDKADTKPKHTAGIAIAVPGPVDVEKGIVLMTPNMALENLPLRDRLAEELGVRVLLENDVSAGTFGEYYAGAAKGYKHVVGLFPGTGVGGGLVLDGRLYRGHRGGAGEIGHVIVQYGGPRCGCGQNGCLEAVASKTAIAKDLVALADAGGAPTVFKEAGTSIAAIKSSVIEKAIDAGEQAVIEVVRRAGHFLGVGMAGFVNTFNPELIVVGGGLVEKLGMRIYLEAAVEAMKSHAMAHLVADVEVKEAALGDDAVVLGAAALLLAEGS